jgi:protein-S-isoprenylcysteine O-methyltransferase Ste14
MKTAMTLFGCGPKLALICLPYILLSIIIMIRYPDFFNLGFLDLTLFKIFGAIWLGLGLIFWVYAATYFLKYFQPGNLITKGPFGLCRNPIYSAIIVFIIPALAIIFHSGLTFSIAVVLYTGFKISIHGETIVLRRLFGEAYEIYEKSVNEIFPFPRYLFG